VVKARPEFFAPGLFRRQSQRASSGCSSGCSSVCSSAVHVPWQLGMLEMEMSGSLAPPHLPGNEHGYRALNKNTPNLRVSSTTPVSPISPPGSESQSKSYMLSLPPKPAKKHHHPPFKGLIHAFSSFHPPFRERHYLSDRRLLLLALLARSSRGLC
jgi:hypothetical protein